MLKYAATASFTHVHHIIHTLTRVEQTVSTCKNIIWGFGATVNDDVSTTSGLGCDGICCACSQVRCTNSNYCTDNGRNSHNKKMAQTADAATNLKSLGIVDIEYRWWVPCSYSGKNITFKINKSNTYPSYLAFVIAARTKRHHTGATIHKVIPALQRRCGAFWTSTPPSGPLSIRMLFSLMVIKQMILGVFLSKAGNQDPFMTLEYMSTKATSLMYSVLIKLAIKNLR
ncbi:Expansin-like B1 [Bienertia sinuspersici]